MDDFGTGYSSLSHLLKFPFDKIKIDKSFVRASSEDMVARDILRSIASLGNTLKIDITAEGVETQEQVDFLRGIACSQLQGYYFAKPLDEVDLARYFLTQFDLVIDRHTPCKRFRHLPGERRMAAEWEQALGDVPAERSERSEMYSRLRRAVRAIDPAMTLGSAVGRLGFTGLGMPVGVARQDRVDGGAVLARAVLDLRSSAFAGLAHAEGGKELRGVALVIGQSDYENIPKLTNPEHDARAIEEMLDSLGFETDVSNDRDARKLRRDLEGFVEDAEGADVAIIYYSGHGIEAGGENFLVPVDADVGSLEDAGEKLVPLSQILAELKKSVPVTIVLLDACRNDPFPPGSVLKLSPDGEAKPIGAGGLGETRGVVALKDPGSSSGADDSLGQVIGFAAEPGKVALDGDAGGNSPYAAAILRHLGAMRGAGIRHRAAHDRRGGLSQDLRPAAALGQ